MNISIERLSKSFGLQKAVDDISFEVKTGEIVGFLGPNGAGKTTTMKMITQYIKPDMGQILIAGKPVNGVEIKKHIGYLPEHNPLYEEMPVLDYLAFCASLQGVSKDLIPVRVRDMVKDCGLDIEKHKKIGELSKGYKQRVGLAQALIHDPEILILDEPTTGLDPNQIVEIRELIKNLGKEKTVILSTHILPEVEATCDRILIINRGRIVADGTADTLRKQSEGKQILKVKIDHSNTEEVISALRNIHSIAQVDWNPNMLQHFEIQSHNGMQSNAFIFKLCAERHWDLLEMIPFETKLEDIFRDLTIN